MFLRRKRAFSKAVTLTELLIASSLVGIVTMGAASILLGMQRIHGATQSSSFLIVHTSAVMSHLQRNILQAVGLQGDEGIVLSPLATPPYYSFREDVDTSLVSNSTPESFADDTWVVYVYDASTDSLSYCYQSAATGSAPGAVCLSHLTLLSDRIQALSITMTGSTSGFYVDVSVTTQIDPNTTSDPMTNPSFTLSTRLTPASHTW